MIEPLSPSESPSRGARRIGACRRPGLRGRTARALLALAAALTVTGTAACGDDPFQIDWEVAPDTALLYSLNRPELNLPSAFNFDRRTTVRVESVTATGNWDLALDTREGQFVLLPPGALGIDSRAAITTVPGMAFPDVTRAPADTAVYVSDEPVPVEVGTVYVIRTGQVAGTFGRRCVFYAKMEPLELSPDEESMRFQFDSNPVCNDRDLVPPDS